MKTAFGLILTLTLILFTSCPEPGMLPGETDTIRVSISSESTLSMNVEITIHGVQQTLFNVSRSVSEVFEVSRDIPFGEYGPVSIVVHNSDTDLPREKETGTLLQTTFLNPLRFLHLINDNSISGHTIENGDFIVDSNLLSFPITLVNNSNISITDQPQAFNIPGGYIIYQKNEIDIHVEISRNDEQSWEYDMNDDDDIGYNDFTTTLTLGSQ